MLYSPNKEGKLCCCEMKEKEAEWHCLTTATIAIRHTDWQKRLTLSPRSFHKATHTTSKVFKTIFSFNWLKMIPNNQQNHENILETRISSTIAFRKQWWWESETFRNTAMSCVRSAQPQVRASDRLPSKMFWPVFRMALLSHPDYLLMPQIWLAGFSRVFLQVQN